MLSCTMQPIKLAGSAGAPDGRQTRQPLSGCSTRKASQANTGEHRTAEARVGDFLGGLTGSVVIWRPAGPVLSPLEWCVLLRGPRPAAAMAFPIPASGRPPLCTLLTPWDLHRNVDWPSLADGVFAIWIGADSASGLVGTAMQSAPLAADFVLRQWSPVIRMIDDSHAGWHLH